MVRTCRLTVDAAAAAGFGIVDDVDVPARLGVRRAVGFKDGKTCIRVCRVSLILR